VSASFPTLPFSLALTDAGLHAIMWVTALILEIVHYSQVRTHVDAVTGVDTTYLHTLHAYNAASMGSLITLIITVVGVVGLVLFHFMWPFEEAKLPGSLLGLVVGCAKSSVVLMTVLLFFFLSDESSIGHKKSGSSWLGEPQLWIAVLIVKIIAIATLQANIFYAGPGALPRPDVRHGNQPLTPPNY
jgi:hypothetical protein